MEDPPSGKLPFRATCDKCGSWLHCCKNCKHYRPGLPNDCFIPGTEYIADREGCNFCEEYALLGKGADQKGSASDASKRLFGEDTTERKKSFDSLFNNEDE